MRDSGGNFWVLTNATKLRYYVCMEIKGEIIHKLKAQGVRLTKVRGLLLEILENHHLPLTELEIREKLRQKGRSVNKTTVYRALQYLMAKKIIIATDLGEGKKRFELDSGHHHHLICNNCKKIEEIKVEDGINNLLKKIRAQKQFAVTGHALEFFGLCKHCNK